MEELAVESNSDHGNEGESHNDDTSTREPIPEVHNTACDFSSQHVHQTGQKVNNKGLYQAVDRSPYQVPLTWSQLETNDQGYLHDATLSRSESPMLRFRNETMKDQPWNGVVGFMKNSESYMTGGSGQTDASSAGTSQIAENGSK